MDITSNIQHIMHRIRQAEAAYQRRPNSVKLLAVSKGQDISKIAAAFAQGLTCFGENYVQEAIAKITSLNNPAIEWHFIGNIQTNKTKLIAEHFAWVHSINRLKIAERLNAQRPANLPPLNICLEVNITQAENKSGADLGELDSLANAIKQLPKLKLRGLMTILEPTLDFNRQRANYQCLYQAFINLQQKGFVLDTLSMGMSDDLEAAIAEGATIVRIGTAIFGKRN